MIEVAHLQKSFAGAPKRFFGKPAVPAKAVVDVSFTARDGRITALLGPNGAGKTTTLRILETLMLPDAGSARVDGIDVTTDPLGVRSRLGVLSDARGLYTRLSARENIAYHARLRGVTQAIFDERLRRLAALLDMEALLERRTEGFSTGEKMKVSLARALIHDPTHLILDEPTSGLDVMSTRALRRLLLAQRDAGKCILFSTHIMQEVEQLCDEIVVIARGRTLAGGTTADLRRMAATESLEDAFVALALAGERSTGAAPAAPPEPIATPP